MLLDVTKLQLKPINGSEAFSTVGKQVLAGLDQVERQKEHVFVFGLDTRHHVQYVDRVSTGTLDASLIHPREIFRQAIAFGVSAIAIMHNHPSGDITPSREDKHVTKRLSEAGKNLGIDVLDHMIVGSKTLTRSRLTDHEKP